MVMFFFYVQDPRMRRELLILYESVVIMVFVFDE